MGIERFEISRQIEAPAEEIFAILTDPQGHVRIDSSGMLQWAEGDPVRQVGDRFVVHMDRESLNDLPMGKYDVTVIITRFAAAAEIEWMISGTIQPPIEHLWGYTLEPSGSGTRVSAYYDWSRILPQYRGLVNFPIIPESGLRATLGILARTVEKH